MATARIRSSGFTLIELLVVIAIIGLLIGLLIPAIQASREASRRAHCTNNLKQFGIAFSNFESQNRTFPAGLTAHLQGPIVSVGTGHMHGVLVDLLPFIEEGNIDALYDHKAMFFAPQNAAAIAMPMGIAHCPSSPGDREPVSGTFKMSQMATPSVMEQFGAAFDALDAKYTGTYRGTTTDYAVPVKAAKAYANSLGYNVSDSFAELPGMFPLPPLSEILPSILLALIGPSAVIFNERTQVREVTDGLSHTFMMTEAAGRPEHWEKGNRTYTDEPLPCAWANPLAMGVFINGETGDPAMQKDNNHEIYSFHPGGVNFLFADGHVEYLAEDTPPRLILGLMTPSHGETLDAH
ncbi:MAG: DUF1559 domain-containing protein [Pirellulales bacterium]